MDDPGAERRAAKLSSASYAVRAPLSSWLRSEAKAAAQGDGYRVLDVGCGVMPYRPFFAPFSRSYAGVDVEGNSCADLVGTVEALPVEDASFDVVICTQVLEHCEDPSTAVRELRRVTAPGGRVLVSTHGVYPYHPSPRDNWRWTHEGLESLFRANADWSSVDVAPASGTAACVAMVLALYLDLLCKRLQIRLIGRPLIAALNAVGATLDSTIPALRELRPGALTANYHVTARP